MEELGRMDLSAFVEMKKSFRLEYVHYHHLHHHIKSFQSLRYKNKLGGQLKIGEIFKLYH